MVAKIVYKEESYAVLGACCEVYNEQDCGFLEAVYQECFKIEFGSRNIPFIAQPKLKLSYKGRQLKQLYQPDFLCLEKIVLEIKAASNLSDQHWAQVHNYLKTTGLKLGLLVNFGQYPKLQYERIVR